MKRPFIYFGTTTIISLAVFNLLGFKCASVLFFISIILLPVLFFIRNKSKHASAAFICILALLTSCGSFCTKTVTSYLPATELCSDRQQSVSGTLFEYEQVYGGHYYTITKVTVNGTETKAKIRVYSPSALSAEIDDTLTFTAATIYKAGSSSGNSAYYIADGIYISAYNHGATEITKAEKHSVNYYLNGISEYVTASLSHIGNKDLSAIAVGMITGNQTDINDDILQNFRYSGIAHLFAVSGFHLTLWTSAVNLSLGKIFKKKHFISTLASIIFVLFFMAFTGFTKSVTRAGIMLLVILFGKLIKHNSELLNSLFGAISLILIANPYAVMSASLQMSFLATFGIILLSAAVSEPLQKIKNKFRHAFTYKISELFYTSFSTAVIATLFTLPVSAISFGYFSLLSPITNLLCLPAAQLAMMLSALATIFSPVAAISKPILIVTALLLKYILFITEKIAHTANAVAETSSIIEKALFTAVIITVILLILIFRKNKKHLRTVLISSYVCVLTVACIMFAIQSDSIKATVADVGNGTSVVLNIKGKNIIIGCGGSAYKNYRFTDAADTENTMHYDMIIIPRNTATESNYAYTVLSRYDFGCCICCSQKLSSYITAKLPENTRITDYYSCRLDENCDLVYINNEDFCGVRIEAADFSLTVIFRPTVDFSSVDESWQKGSLLITRQALPDIDLSGFDNIIVSSSAKTAYYSDSIFSTAHSGQIIYRTYPFSFTSITEANNDF